MKLPKRRNREYLMRKLERADIPILAGMQIYRNYVRPHEALQGKTLSELAGIKVDGKNKWMTIIQNASKRYYDRMYRCCSKCYRLKFLE